MIPARWKLPLACALAIWLLLAGYWLKGLVEEAKQAETLREQVKANAAAQDRINGIAAETETKLAANRRREAEINRKWNTIREAESRAVCTLDDDVISLLRDATVPASLPAR